MKNALLYELFLGSCSNLHLRAIRKQGTLQYSTLNVHTRPHRRGTHVGEERLSVCVVDGEIWPLFGILGKALLLRRFSFM